MCVGRPQFTYPFSEPAGTVFVFELAVHTLTS